MLSLLIVSALLSPGYGPGAAPDTAGRVVIHRDDFGVPHIFASTIEEGFYGLGYAQAEDILEPLLLLIARGRGELAARTGAPGLASDIEHRRWRMVEAAEAGFRALSPTLSGAYRQYIAGIGAFLARHPDQAPAWTEGLVPRDALVLTRSLLWLAYQAGIGLADCRRGGIRLADAAALIPGASPSLASDEWVLAPWRTAEGGTIVLSDPHGETDGTLFYEFRMHAGPLQSSGYALGPMLLLTHNRTLAWGQTTGSPDVADCYEVEVDPANPLRYRYDGQWKTMVTHRVTIPVKGGRPETRTLEYTRHNGVLSPVVARAGPKAYVVSSAYMDPAATAAFDEEVFRLNLAQSVAEAKAVMSTVGMYPQNWMFGDAGGTIWYVRAGRTPIRPAGFDWSRPVPGNTTATAWKGIHPLDDLVQVLNPPEGYLTNNNIAPDRMLPSGPVSADRYPAYIFNDTPGRTNTRGLRAIEALSAAYAFTVEDAIQLALDEKWMGVDRLQRLLQAALASRPEQVRVMSNEFRRFADDLLRFDGVARASSSAALEFVYWHEALGKVVPAALLPELDRAITSSTAPAGALAGAVMRAIDTAIARLHRRHSGTPALGDEFRLGRGSRTWPIGGVSILPANLSECGTPIRWTWACLVTLRAMMPTPGVPDSSGRRRVALGSRALRLVSLTDPIKAYSLHLYGQSADPESPHYEDQVPLASERRLKPEYFEPAELEGHIASTTRLTVGANGTARH